MYSVSQSSVAAVHRGARSSGGGGEGQPEREKFKNVLKKKFLQKMQKCSL